jgi:hypothetical protein
MLINLCLAFLALAPAAAVQGPPPTTVPGIITCEPTLAGVIGCPCGNNPSGAGRGCNNSLNTGGAALTATGMNSLSADSVQFNCTGIGTKTVSCSGSNTNVLCRLYEGSTPISLGAWWGDGVICTGGPFYILNQALSVSGTYHWPIPGTTGVSSKAISLGDPIVVGSTRWYFVAYRDMCASFCPGSVRQKSNSYTIIWGP